MKGRHAETARRVAIVIEWLNAHPTGGSSKEIHNACDFGRDWNTMQKLLQRMVRAGDPIIVVGTGSHMRYAAPMHIEAAQAHFDALIAARKTKWSRICAQRRALEQEAAEMQQASGYERGEEMRQVVVSEWVTPKKLGPRSVFELAHP